jgi:uncharacterized protein (DUF1778 family)
MYCELQYNFREENEHMATIQPRPTPPKAATLMIRLDEKSKRMLRKAAELRGMSVSDYVRTATVQQAEREIRADRNRIIAMTPEEQLAFWKALNEPPKLTAAQKKLGAIIRGEA